MDSKNLHWVPAFAGTTIRRRRQQKEETMSKFPLVCIAASICALLSGVSYADDRGISRGEVQRFATLPDGVRFPEGITANPRNGDVYVATFDFGPNANALLRYSRHGQLLGSLSFGGAPLLGLEFDRRNGKVYIANFGASKIQRIAADLSGAVEDVATIPNGSVDGIGAPNPRTETNPDQSSDTIAFGSNKFPAPNAMTFGRGGSLYVSDSFQGAIYRIDNAAHCAVPCSVTVVAHDPLLATAGFPPFGANGLALNDDESALFVANTGDDRVLKLDLATNTVGVFAESINGADGIAFDDDGRLWVAANQNDEIVALNGQGRVVDRVGRFERVRRDGSPDGLLFPASIVFVGDTMYVTNLALPLTGAVGDEPEEDVTRYTVSRIRMR
jgi:DNA-binding beta-propeller fold protein YncE